MIDHSKAAVDLPLEQQAIRDKCFHPSGDFVEFLEEEVEQSIPERFEKIVRLYPHRLAIKGKDTSFTYEELNDHANRIAHSILAAVGTGNRPVAILMKHGASVVAAIQGALKAGKIYVPLDPAYPQERLRFILQDAQAELILVQPETGVLAASISEGKLPAIDVEHLSACVANDDVGLHIPPSAFAYIAEMALIIEQNRDRIAVGQIEHAQETLHEISEHEANRELEGTGMSGGGTPYE